MMKKIFALVLAVVMVLAMGATAFADGVINGGNTSAAPALATENDTGVAGTWIQVDTENVQEKSINIVKEIKSFNATSTSVYAPAFTYVYTVKPATVSNFTVIDQTTDHASGNAATAPIQQGITTGLIVTGGTSTGTAGTETQAVGTLVFTNANTLTTSSAGYTNTYNINLNFADVSFTKPGVYRYEITETLDNSATYAGIDIEAGNSEETKVRYLDVYVDGNLNIYGYVCMSTNGNVTESTTKTNGFVEASNGHDKYYTYDLTLSKDVVNDTWAEANVAFPFTVIFNNTENFTTTYSITETAANGSTGFTPAAASAPTWSGVARVKDGANIVYSGIPAGVDVDVYETNIVTGVTYTVETSVNNATTGDGYQKDENVTAGSTPATAVTQTTKAAYESTKKTVGTEKYTTSKAGTTAAQSVKITNTLLLISPTGVALRIAPYVGMLVAGIALIVVVAVKRRKNEEDAEA